MNEENSKKTGSKLKAAHKFRDGDSVDRSPAGHRGS
jgi:hypothetical protein